MFKKFSKEAMTLIGADTFIKGELNSKGTVRVDGNFEGTITADWVIVGETGTIKGDIKARGAIIGGKVYGFINSTESLEIKHKAEVYGEICTQKLSISEGAIFEGQSCMQKLEKTKEESSKNF